MSLRMSPRFPIQNRRILQRFRYLYPISLQSCSVDVPGSIRERGSQVPPPESTAGYCYLLRQFRELVWRLPRNFALLLGYPTWGDLLASIPASKSLLLPPFSCCSRREVADDFPALLICNGFLSASVLPRWRQAMSTLVSSSTAVACNSQCLFVAGKCVPEILAPFSARTGNRSPAGPWLRRQHFRAL